MRIKDTYKNWSLKKHVRKFGSKNNGYFNYFDKKWFVEHQRILIFLLNNSLLKYWFRFVLRIHKDCKFSEYIDKIEPNTYRVKLNANTFRSDFRTHNKFSKRIYYGFYLVWWTLHLLDWIIQRTYNPEFSFGFDTLTAYPDAGSGNTTVDGAVYIFSALSTYSTLRNAATGATGDALESYWVALNADVNANTFAALIRYIMLFDSSSLSSSATISAAAISLYDAYSKETQLGSPSYHVVSSAPASDNALAAGDYDSLGETSFGSIANASITAGHYNAFSLNSSGIGNISLTSISKFGLRDDWDINNSFGGTWTDSGRSRWKFFHADQTGTSYDPELVVTYTTEVIEQIAGTAAGAATAEMKLTAVKKMVMSAAGAAAAEMNLQVGNFLPLGVAQCAATAEMKLTAEKKMTLTSAGGSSASLKLTAEKKMSLSSAGVGYAVAHVGVYIGLAGSSAGAAAAEMNLLEANYMQMPSNGNSTAEMKLSVIRKLKGASAGNASAVSDLRLGTHVLTLENSE